MGIAKTIKYFIFFIGIADEEIKNMKRLIIFIGIADEEIKKNVFCIQSILFFISSLLISLKCDIK